MIIQKTFLKSNKNNLKVFLLFEENNVKSLLKKHNIKYPKNVLDDFSGKMKEIIQFYNREEIVVLLGLGKKEEMNIDKLKHIIKHLYFLIKKMDKQNIIFYLANGSIDFLKDQIKIINDLNYEMKDYMDTYFKNKNKKLSKKKVISDNKYVSDNNNNNNNLANNKSKKKLKGKKNIIIVFENHNRDLNKFLILLNSVNLVKNLGNAPANVITPPSLVNITKNLGRQNNFNVIVMGHKTLRKMGMDTLLSVSQGSRYSGYLVKITPKYANLKEKPIVLVGKGITFDSGGTSLKRPRGMINMKTDMLGAATILGYINYLGSIKSKKNVIGLLAIAENMPGKFASRPGDVVKSYSGKTVEIVDTDAEGRLVMADALAYAHEFKPKLIMNIAGLTGQQSKISGGLFATIMGNNPKKNREFIKVGDRVNERLVEFPLYQEYIEQTKSDIADLKNYNYNFKHGTIYAGAFLCNFIKEGQNWIHLDIAGPESDDEGVTGFGVRLLNNFI